MLFINFKAIVAMINRRDNVKDKQAKQKKKKGILGKKLYCEFSTFALFVFFFCKKNSNNKIIALQIDREIFKRNIKSTLPLKEKFIENLKKE